ncbi:MAG: hypothetical protein EKK40_11565 [Bradyrhizobiaceae bacterium]|nr:MAG: hypothetical protein EKK40_11565 [Bradyrhizobiaceae bacterium]
MQPKSASSRDMKGSLPRKDSEREKNQAVIKDADKTETKDWDKVHGDGSQLDLDKPERNAQRN